MRVVKSRNKKADVKTDAAFYAQVRDMFVQARQFVHRFYLPFRNCHTLCDELSWSHLHNKRIFAAKYKLHLPSEQELIAELRRERTAIEYAQLVTKLNAGEIRRSKKFLCLKCRRACSTM